MLLLVEVFLKYDRFPFLNGNHYFRATSLRITISEKLQLLLLYFFFANFNSPLELCCKFSLLKSFEEMFLVLTNSKFI